MPAVPAHIIAEGLAANDAAAVYVAVEKFLREATDEPSHRDDPAAWRAWRDMYYAEIADVAREFAIGRRP